MKQIGKLSELKKGDIVKLELATGEEITLVIKDDISEEYESSDLARDGDIEEIKTSKVEIQRAQNILENYYYEYYYDGKEIVDIWKYDKNDKKATADII